MNDRRRRERFDRDVLPYLDSAYNLARWLTRSDDDAQDVVQEACLRAFRALDNLVATDGKSWLLSIVRNTAHSFLRKNRQLGNAFEAELDALEWSGPNPEQAVMDDLERELLAGFIEELPVEFREVVVLRELEDLSYKEISEITQMPIGTVMSRLSRARRRLQQRAADRSPEGWPAGEGWRLGM